MHQEANPVKISQEDHECYEPETLEEALVIETQAEDTSQPQASIWIKKVGPFLHFSP